MKSLAFVLIATANILGGISYLWQDLALKGLPPATISLGRNLVAIACLVGFLAARGGVRWRYPWRDGLRLWSIGVFAFAAPLLLGIHGVRLSSAGNASILVLLEPAAILVLSWLMLHERIRPIQVGGIATALGGALLIVTEGAPVGDLFGGENLLGNLILALHGILWGLYTPLMKPLVMRYRPLDLTLGAAVSSLFLLVPAAILEAREWEAGPYLVPAIFWIIVLGVLVSFGATILWNQSLKYLPAFTVAVFVFLQPLAGVSGDAIFRDRDPTPEAISGGALIIAGVFLVILPSRWVSRQNGPGWSKGNHREHRWIPRRQ